MTDPEMRIFSRAARKLKVHSGILLLAALVFLTAAGSLFSLLDGTASANSGDNISSQTDIQNGDSPAVAGEKTAQPLVAISSQDAPLCDFGVNASHAIESYDTTPLRIGWYLDYSASASPSEPNGANYAPLISIQQTGPNSYTYNPNGAALSAAISANPGAAWFISNEPDRRDWQDDLEPHIYAASYHELYYLIKGADPTAQIFAGSIVQPTPLRLLYLDMVLDSYWDAYGELMPVDGWSIHNFILNEVSCDYDPDNCWGAEIPPGIDAPYGEILGIQDNDRLDLFIERIVRFRHWMSARGYQGLPLYLSEYGILMPQDFGFPASRVNEYMNNTFDYLLSAADGRHGNPNDEYRLIQKLSWFSTSETFYNGWLYDLVSPGNYELSPMGLNYAAYTAGIPSEIDLYPSILSTDPAAPFSSGDPVTLTLSATIANSGNMITETGSVTVRFYDGDPSSGGVQIGADQTVSLRGCGDNETVSVTWFDLAPGVYRLFVVVDPEDEIIDSDRNNNTASRLVIVATDRTHTPLIQFTG